LNSVLEKKNRSDILKICGGRPLKGEVVVQGAKNSLPKIMVASLLTKAPCILKNVAPIKDVEIIRELISALGGKVQNIDSTSIVMETPKMSLVPAKRLEDFSGQSRIPILLCGPLLARLGEAIVPSLGGCQIGTRPVDFHLSALRSLGAKITETPYGYHLKAKKLYGNKIHLDYPSVGATEQVLLASVLAEGVTELSNAANEPEIIELIAVLQKMGANISVDLDRVINIRGVSELKGFEHSAMTDRLEVASWACAAIVTNGKIFVKHATQLDMMTFLNKFRQIGGEFDVKDDGIFFWRKSKDLKSLALETGVHPGFMTDWQQAFVVALTQADGVSVVHETVYENRLGYVSTLNHMGAKIQLYQECLGSHFCRFGQRNYLHSAVIVGPTQLKSAAIHIPDLRGGFSYVIAALAAEGISTIQNIQLIYRGYGNFIEKLVHLGADILE
jgi:UDP-N-acetylglucosamine 1-carboxyvinyltransferase